LSDLNKTRIFGQIFQKYSNIKFQANSFNGSRVVPSEKMDGNKDGQTDRHRHTDMTRLIIALNSCANAPKTQDKYAQRRHCSMNDILYEM